MLRAYGKLCAAACWFGRGNNRKLRRRTLSQKRLKISCQSHALRSQAFHARLMKNIHRCPQSCQTHDWRIAQLPTLRAGHCTKFRAHLETRSFVVTPPTREARQIVGTRVPLMDEASCDASRSPIKIFITAPNGEIRSQRVQLQWKISRGVSEIETHNASPCTARAHNLL